MADKIKVLVMGGHTKGFHEFGIMGPIYQKFLTEAGFDVRITEDRDDFKKDALAPFDVIVDYTTGEDLTADQAGGLMGGIVGGKGFVGVHSAADSFKNTPGYIDMVGGKFLTHPSYWPKLTFNIKNRFHPAMEGLEDFQMEEELYLMETCGHFDLLMSAHYQGFERPITWVKPYGHGRVFYTALGHDKVQTENPNFQRLIVNAVRWAKFAYAKK
jgi:type 1 glutamine amidotransferase